MTDDAIVFTDDHSSRSHTTAAQNPSPNASREHAAAGDARRAAENADG